MQPLPPPDFFTLEEAATILKVSVDTLRRRIDADEIPFRKIGSQYRLPGWWVMLGAQPDSPTTPATQGTSDPGANG